MSRRNHPDDKGRPSISPREQLANVRNALVGDEQERFERAFEKEWNDLPQKERAAISGRVDAVIRSAIERSNANPSVLPIGSSARGQKSEKGSWAKEAIEEKSRRGDRQLD